MRTPASLYPNPTLSAVPPATLLACAGIPHQLSELVPPAGSSCGARRRARSAVQAALRCRLRCILCPALQVAEPEERVEHSRQAPAGAWFAGRDDAAKLAALRGRSTLRRAAPWGVRSCRGLSAGCGRRRRVPADVQPARCGQAEEPQDQAHLLLLGALRRAYKRPPACCALLRHGSVFSLQVGRIVVWAGREMCLFRAQLPAARMMRCLCGACSGRCAFALRLQGVHKGESARPRHDDMTDRVCLAPGPEHGGPILELVWPAPDVPPHGHGQHLVRPTGRARWLLSGCTCRCWAAQSVLFW